VEVLKFQEFYDSNCRVGRVRTQWLRIEQPQYFLLCISIFAPRDHFDDNISISSKRNVAVVGIRGKNTLNNTYRGQQTPAPAMNYNQIPDVLDNKSCLQVGRHFLGFLCCCRAQMNPKQVRSLWRVYSIHREAVRCKAHNQRFQTKDAGNPKASTILDHAGGLCASTKGVIRGSTRGRHPTQLKRRFRTGKLFMAYVLCVKFHRQCLYVARSQTLCSEFISEIEKTSLRYRGRTGIGNSAPCLCPPHVRPATNLISTSNVYRGQTIFRQLRSFPPLVRTSSRIYWVYHFLVPTHFIILRISTNVNMFLPALHFLFSDRQHPQGYPSQVPIQSLLRPGSRHVQSQVAV
jgi:hypothetical protein